MSLDRRMPREPVAFPHMLCGAAMVVLPLGLLALATVGSPRPARGDAPAAAQPIAMPLWNGKAPGPEVFANTGGKIKLKGEALTKANKEANVPMLFAYLPEKPAGGAALVICPGGGYAGLAISYEGHDVARWFQARGVAAFVLRYRLPNSKVPGAAHGVPLYDAQRAIRLVRGRAEEWHINPARVGILGFSAGGHLASTADTHFDRGEPGSADPIQRVSCRPDFAMLVYPVITADPAVSHKGSFIRLLGPKPDPKLLEFYSNDRHVTADTPPTMLVHASDDPAVPVENSIRFFEALKKAKVPAEMHLYERGGHGFSMRPKGGPATQWMNLAIDWMRVHGWVDEPSKP